MSFCDNIYKQLQLKKYMRVYSHRINRFCHLQESAIEAKFTEVNAINKQRLVNLEFTQSLLNQVQCAPDTFERTMKADG